ncbi:MAG: hypothetical protein II996_04570 [Oscillospiraceae bacterium]|nr:hypothetical protein [Oscillospiraceae bacterium]
MKFGISKEVITPIKPMKLACSGVFEKDFTYIHDDVYVRCLVVDDGANKAVFMSFDLLFHDRTLNNAVEVYAKDKYNISPSAVIISYTHSHPAPASRGYNPGAHDVEYEELLLSRAKSCLDRAMCSMFEGTFEYGTFDADFNISRRALLEDGKYHNAPNYNYPHDTEFTVMCIRDTVGDVRSVVMNYPCHPVFYPTRDSVSGEFPARLCQLIDAKYYGCISLYFQSTAGDVRPRPTAGKSDDGRDVWKGGLTFSDVDKFAKSICESVCEFIEENKCEKLLLSLASDDFEIELEIDPQPLEVFENMMKMHDVSGIWNPNVNNANYILNGGYDELPNSMMLHCQTLRLTDNLYIATVGGEPCFGVKKAVAEAFKDKKICFIGYTDACAYVVDDKILSEGGYEATCHNEYRHKGPFKAGLDKLYKESFEESFKRILKAAK